MLNETHPFPLPSEVFGNVQTPENVSRAAALERSFLWRWAKGLHRRIYGRLLAGRNGRYEGSFIYRAGGDQRRITFNGRNGQFHALYDQGYRAGYEAESAFLLLRLARGDRVFFDVGANWGYFSLLLAASPSYRGRIYAFEPNPTTFTDLQHTIKSAELTERITGLQAGIGAAAGELRLSASDPFRTGLARLEANGDGSVVPVHSIDALNLPKPDIIKIDAEGMELAVLKGAAQTLASQRPHIVFENFRHFDQPELTRAPLEFLLRHGYRLFNPALAFSSAGGPVLASYDAPLATLLAREPRPPTALVPITPANRFLMAHQLNVWACHSSRLTELSPADFSRVDGI